MSILVKKCQISEIEGNANFPALAHAYAQECAIAGLPAPDEKIAAYRGLAGSVLSASSVFQAYGAFLGDVLVGFIAVLTPVIPHYGVAIAVTESLFVAKEYRNTGAGLMLLRAAKQHAREAKSPGMLVSAPVGGPLAAVLEGLSEYRETNRVFFTDLAEARGLTKAAATIPAMSHGAIEKVRQLETIARAMPQVSIATTHTFHAGMYARTVMVPAGVMLTGALIKIATVLIVSGHALVYMDGEPREINGYAVLAASAGRKQAFVAQADTHLTMLFATDAATIEQAEREFTDESDLLFSRDAGATNIVMEP